MILTDEDKREFAERGYLVVPGVLSRREIDHAMAVVDDLIAAAPPPAGHVGHHFYWPALETGHPLLGLLLDGAAFDAPVNTVPDSDTGRLGPLPQRTSAASSRSTQAG
jgi:hypothetical protein